MSIRFPIAFLNSMTSPLEMGMVIVAILVLFGAKSLPGTLRTIGHWMEKLRLLSDEFRGQLMDVDQEVRTEFDEWNYDFDAETVSSGPERPEVPAETSEESSGSETELDTDPEEDSDER